MVRIRSVEEFTERFEKRFIPEPNSGCWLWLEFVNSETGYGQTKNIQAITGNAHRISYELYVGKVPEGLQLDHLCRNRICVNPEHLEPVTSQTNNLRSPFTATSINKSKTHCIRGHQFTEANIYRTPLNQRKCKACLRNWSRLHYQKRV